MPNINPPYVKIILICTRSRADGSESCSQKGSEDLFEAFKNAAREKKLPFRIVKSGCLGQCTLGPTVVVMPDNRWFTGVSPADISSILGVE